MLDRVDQPVHLYTLRQSHNLFNPCTARLARNQAIQLQIHSLLERKRLLILRRKCDSLRHGKLYRGRIRKSRNAQHTYRRAHVEVEATCYLHLPEVHSHPKCKMLVLFPPFSPRHPLSLDPIRKSHFQIKLYIPPSRLRDIHLYRDF